MSRFILIISFFCMHVCISKWLLKGDRKKRIGKIEMAIWNEKPPKRCEGSTYILNSCSQSLRLNGGSVLAHWQASTMEPQHGAIFLAQHTSYAMGLISQISLNAANQSRLPFSNWHNQTVDKRKENAWEMWERRWKNDL